MRLPFVFFDVNERYQDVTPGDHKALNYNVWPEKLGAGAMRSSQGAILICYIDPYDPILDGHRSVVGIYRSLKFMVAQNLPLPWRIDFALYITPIGAPYDQIFQRGLDDADATLPSLGAPKLYGVAETDYLADPAQRLQYAQAYATQAAQSPRMQMVSFWTVPATYPFTIEDYLPLPPQ